MSRIAVYPGTFDPITNGHIGLIKRASHLFDQLIVAVAMSSRKTPCFELNDRLAMSTHVLADLKNVTVKTLDGLLVDFAKANKASIILRGLRVVSDFDYEFQLAGMNRRMAPSIETVFLPATEDTAYISASIIKEIISLGGDVSSFVPPVVLEYLQSQNNAK